jgi:hypothetical protein
MKRNEDKHTSNEPRWNNSGGRIYDLINGCSNFNILIFCSVVQKATILEKCRYRTLSNYKLSKGYAGSNQNSHEY